VNTLLEDKEFQKTIKKIRPETADTTANDMGGTIRAYMIESIVRFNQERRLKWSPNASENVFIPENTYFIDYQDLQTIETVVKKTDEKEQQQDVQESIEQKIDVGSAYVDKKLDAQ
jgi:hypothetical protein